MSIEGNTGENEKKRIAGFSSLLYLYFINSIRDLHHLTIINLFLCIEEIFSTVLAGI